MIRIIPKVSSVWILLLFWLTAALSIVAYTPSQGAHQGPHPTILHGATGSTAVVADKTPEDSIVAKDPLLIRAARGETNIERTPVWMMRQAGRHIKEYRDLCKEYPTFRQRSEITEVAVEVSLQPWRNYQTDGCILFSDILTPLPGMGCEFVIDEAKGPIMTQPIRTQDDLKLVRRCRHTYLLGIVLCIYIPLISDYFINSCTN
jgi:Uroporphyrinogen decarboxylase (URO-D)